MARGKNVTFSDIAAYTHFSKTTISRYFNNPDSLTLENQQIISEALTALNYKENKVARILANGKTEFVGIIIPNLFLHYYSEILNHILSTYEQFGYKFLVFVGDENDETERRYIQELLAYKIEGMIILSHTISSEELASYQIPIVTIEREDQHVCSVNTDNYMGAVQAVSLLKKHNCEVFIHINTPTPDEVPASGRIRGFIDFCTEHELEHEAVITRLGNEYEAIYASIEKILTHIEQKYTGKRIGFFISNDTHANILLNILVRKYGMLPDNYYIIGFDDSPASREAVIPISTIGQQIDRQAFEAVSLLVDQMNERKKRKPAPMEQIIHKMVPPVLIRRETTEKAPFRME